eukprot:SAG25_NODE_4832_length_743_cov_1.850356_3_plen_109_part_00
MTMLNTVRIQYESLPVVLGELCVEATGQSSELAAPVLGLPRLLLLPLLEPLAQALEQQPIAAPTTNPATRHHRQSSPAGRRPLAMAGKHAGWLAGGLAGWLAGWLAGR